MKFNVPYKIGDRTDAQPSQYSWKLAHKAPPPQAIRGRVQRVGFLQAQHVRLVEKYWLHPCGEPLAHNHQPR